MVLRLFLLHTFCSSMHTKMVLDKKYSPGGPRGPGTPLEKIWGVPDPLKINWGLGGPTYVWDPPILHTKLPQDLYVLKIVQASRHPSRQTGMTPSCNKTTTASLSRPEESSSKLPNASCNHPSNKPYCSPFFNEKTSPFQWTNKYLVAKTKVVIWSKKGIFGVNWYEKYPWLHLCTTNHKLDCFLCMRFNHENADNPAFTRYWFKRWNISKAAFDGHEKALFTGIHEVLLNAMDKIPLWIS